MGAQRLWDYGPLGVELKRNLKDFWWRRHVREREDMVGMDGSIIMNRAVWKASGHEDTFSDPIVDCRSCKSRHRADQLPLKDGAKYCPICGSRDLTEPRDFNLMFKSFAGPIEVMRISFIFGPKRLRPSLFSSRMFWKPAVKSSPSASLKFGKPSATKSIRAIIHSAPANSNRWKLSKLCRAEDGLRLTDYWLEERLRFYEDIGIPRAKIRVHDMPDAERAFYSKRPMTSNTTFLSGERA